jgi:hypothetical protein
MNALQKAAYAAQRPIALGLNPPARIFRKNDALMPLEARASSPSLGFFRSPQKNMLISVIGYVIIKRLASGSLYFSVQYYMVSHNPKHVKISLFHLS